MCLACVLPSHLNRYFYPITSSTYIHPASLLLCPTYYTDSSSNRDGLHKILCTGEKIPHEKEVPVVHTYLRTLYKCQVPSYNPLHNAGNQSTRHTPRKPKLNRGSGRTGNSQHINIPIGALLSTSNDPEDFVARGGGGRGSRRGR